MKKALLISAASALILTATIAIAFNIVTTQKKVNLPADTMVRPVKSITLVQPKDTGTRSFPGTVKATRDVKLGFRVSGPIINFNAETGAFLNKGDVIAKIDPRDYMIQIEKIKAGITEAQAGFKAMCRGARDEDLGMLKAKLTADRAQLEEADLTFQRFSHLLKEKAISKAKYDSVKTAYNMAKAKVSATSQELNKAGAGARKEKIEAMTAKIAGLKISLTAAENALKDTILTMPFTGFISGKYSQAFETVKAGMPVVSCIDISTLEISVGIPEEFMVKQKRFSSFTCTLDSFPGITFQAELKEIGKKTAGVDQTYPLTAIIKTADNPGIKPGMAATLNISLKQDPKIRFIIPVEAVFNDGNNNFCVWVINPETGIVSKTVVETGRITSRGMEVLNGLSPGQTIATAGVHYLKEGQKVKPLNRSKS